MLSRLSASRSRSHQFVSGLHNRGQLRYTDTFLIQNVVSYFLIGCCLETSVVFCFHCNVGFKSTIVKPWNHWPDRHREGVQPDRLSNRWLDKILFMKLKRALFTSSRCRWDNSILRGVFPFSGSSCFLHVDDAQCAREQLLHLLRERKQQRCTELPSVGGILNCLC